MEHGVKTGEIWHDVHQHLLAYIRRRVSSVHDAEDILQDVFLRIHANLKRLDGAQNVTAWVYRIARNAVTDYYRRRATSAGAIVQPAGEGNPPAESVPDHGPEEDVTRQAGEEFAGCMEPMLGQLPDHYRQAVTLTELEGMTQKEAAAKFGLSVSGMKAHARPRRQTASCISDVGLVPRPTLPLLVFAALLGHQAQVGLGVIPGRVIPK